MFWIFGLGPKQKVEAQGQFLCPNCSIKTEYKVRSSRQYFRLFFIPIWPVGETIKPFVECQRCNSTYNTEVLENNNYYLDGTPFRKDDKDGEKKTERNEHVFFTYLTCYEVAYQAKQSLCTCGVRYKQSH